MAMENDNHQLNNMEFANIKGTSDTSNFPGDPILQEELSKNEVDLSVGSSSISSEEKKGLSEDYEQVESDHKSDVEGLFSKTKEEQKVCRICYDDDDLDSLCSPCKCCGSIGFVHQSCMFHWIGGRPKLQCEICKHKYEIKRTTKTFSEWQYPWITHHDLYFIFMVIFSQEWIHVMESFILLLSMYAINVMTESSGAGIQFWVIIGLEFAYYSTHYICGLILLFLRKWSALNQQFTLLDYDTDRVVQTTWFSEEGSRLLYCLDLLVSFLLANPILKGMADKMVARAN